MTKSGSRTLPALGASFLKPGDCVVNFYYSADEQCRFAPLLQEAASQNYAIIVASTAERHPLVQHRLQRGLLARRSKKLVQLHVTADLEGSIDRIAAVTAEAIRDAAEARVLVDFAGVVSHDGIFSVEAQLHTALSGMRAITISQYDGNAFPAGITLEQFHTHALTIVGNVFYSENRRFMAPAAYLEARARRAKAAVRAASA